MYQNYILLPPSIGTSNFYLELLKLCFINSKLVVHRSVQLLGHNFLSYRPPCGSSVLIGIQFWDFFLAALIGITNFKILIIILHFLIFRSKIFHNNIFSWSLSCSWGIIRLLKKCLPDHLDQYFHPHPNNHWSHSTIIQRRLHHCDPKVSFP